MPKISASTVVEHHAQILDRLVDAAEKLWRASPGQPLTAARVAAGAGIARNSIYRYVDSVDDLYALVVDRYLPAWTEAVTTAIAGRSAAEQVLAWVETNLNNNAAVGHEWLIGASREVSRSVASPAMQEIASRAHEGILRPLVAAWSQLLDGNAEQVAVAVAFTTAVVDAGFRELDLGRPAPLVLTTATTAVRALVETLPDIGSPRP